MSAERRPNIFTVPAGRPFATALAQAILAGDLPRLGGSPPSPIELSRITLLLPSRRSTLAVQEAFLASGGGRAMLLPRIRPIQDGDENLALLTGFATPAPHAAGALDIPPAISELERRLTLAGLVMRWAAAARASIVDAGDSGDASLSAAGRVTPAQALALAGELGRLMDMVETENVSLARLGDQVHPSFSEHWEQTLAFLEIITEAWPAHLAEKGLISGAERQNRLIRAEAARLAAGPAQGPVIVAGATGSVPATAELMRVVAGLDQGAIVLPALDQGLDAAGWDAIAPIAPVAARPDGRPTAPTAHPEHPQFGLAKLLAALGVARADVLELPGTPPQPARRLRDRLISEALRPARTTDRWQAFIETSDREALRAAVAGVTLIEAPGAHDESEVIALILREALETPGRTAALVSPDRLLARRVVNRLQAWGIDVDDPAGRPFAKTVPGVFLDLLVEAVGRDFGPEPLMALLKNPIVRLGLDPATVLRSARVLELAAFRTLYLGRGLDGAEAALERAAREALSGERRGAAMRRLGNDDFAAARDLLARLRTATEPLAALLQAPGPLALGDLVAAHAATAAAIADPGRADEHNPLWYAEAGSAAERIFSGLLDPAMPPLQVAAADYPEVWRALVGGETVRERRSSHPRLAIWGPFESRLQQPDVVVLGALVDGTWPAAADPGPWLNRTMRASLGLPAPEAAIGRAAHDFQTLLGAGQVYLTRSAKIDGVPTVPSRWLMRLDALLGGLGLREAVRSERPWLGWARLRDAAPPRAPVKAPAPCPPVDLRPRSLAVTGIETWIANPYTIYARHILRLEPLEALGREPDAALKGSLIHAALGRFAACWPATLPGDIAAEFLAIIASVVGDHAGHPRVAAFWLPRMQRFAAWFAETEPARRAGVAAVHAEVSGSSVIAAPGGPFTLRARADRIDVSAGGLAIMDYKTGQAPPDARVLSGASPQLPLEAAIALANGFAGIPPLPVTQLTYIRVTGAEPPGEARTIKAADVAALARASLASLAELVADFDDPATPYRALRRTQFETSYRFDAYAHLARVDEWSGEAGEED